MPQASGEFRGLLPSASREGPDWIWRLFEGVSRSGSPVVAVTTERKDLHLTTNMGG